MKFIDELNSNAHAYDPIVLEMIDQKQKQVALEQQCRVFQSNIRALQSTIADDLNMMKLAQPRMMDSCIWPQTLITISLQVDKQLFSSEYSKSYIDAIFSQMRQMLQSKIA